MLWVGTFLTFKWFAHFQFFNKKKYSRMVASLKGPQIKLGEKKAIRRGANANQLQINHWDAFNH